jgi:hypothetical protein
MPFTCKKCGGQLAVVDSEDRPHLIDTQTGQYADGMSIPPAEYCNIECVDCKQEAFHVIRTLTGVEVFNG